jgi:hypothetical protein
LGIYGPGIATIISVVIKGVLFNVIYLSYILEFNPLRLWTVLIKGCLPSAAFSGFIFYYEACYPIHTVSSLIGNGILFSLFYCLFVYRFVMSLPEKQFCIRVFKFNKLFSAKFVEALLR